MATQGEFLSLESGEASNFTSSGNLFGISLAGTWQQANNIIVLQQLPADFASPVDSVAFTLVEGVSELVYFYDGNEIARQTANQQLTSTTTPTTFLIENHDSGSLKLSQNGYTYHFVPQTPEVVDAGTGFSLYGLMRGLLGMISIIFIALLFSSNRRAINWKSVGIGLGIQILLAFAILKLPPVQFAFESVGQVFVRVLDFTKAGTEFLFAGFLDTSTYGFIFAFQVLPTIIFFSALTSLLFYLGIIQKVVYGLAWVMTKAMRLSGAESLAVAGNIFLGQTEAPLMIKHYLPKMNRSEILMVMTGGMATMAGGVLAAYISFLGGDDPVQRLMFAKHLLAASVMAAPGAVVIAKILVPQTETINTEVVVSKERIGSNILDAISNGTTEGLKLAANVAAMLLVFIAFIAMFNFIAGQIGQWTNLNDAILAATGGQFERLSLQFILGYVFSPIMWLIGVSLPDITLAGRLLGEKIIMTEFIGYVSLAELKEAGAFYDPKTIIMATYMLCGFANFASIGIQIGGIGSLAPNQRVTLSQFGMRALLGGTLAALISATIVGVILG
ncbi:MAG TPA: Na+ dependent nucleoside transporter [Bacteroidales bacterium]|nr:Na+ dependent nucleoside transporter [Bacteroidales bacterium]